MPIYTYKCGLDHEFERFLNLSDYAEPQFCECGWIGERVFTVPVIRPDLPAYQSPIDGKWVEGRAARKRDLARSGCVPYDDGAKEEAEKDRKLADIKLEKNIEETVGREIYNMSPSKRASLKSELAQGANIEFKRLTPGA
jgi:hypothetical protein